jgi:hypothetical protein
VKVPELIAILEHLGICGLMLCIPVLMAYVGAHTVSKESERLWLALHRRWVMITWVVVALFAWAWTWFCVTTGRGWLRGSGRRSWLPMALLLGTVVAGAVALLATRYWPRIRPWLTLLIVVGLCLGSSEIRGPAPDPSFKQNDTGEAVAFIQERLRSLDCYQTDDLSRLTSGKFDAPTANAVIRFQQANDLLSTERDLPHAGGVRREPEFRRLANPWSGLKRCPP